MKILPILYQDDHLVAVNKPAGLLVHRTHLDPHETEHAMQMVRDQLGQWVYPFHRLDKATSGVLLFALDPETGKRMTELFTTGAVTKHYIAIVRGFTKEDERIDYALKGQWDRLGDQRAGKDKPAQQAITMYKRLATIELPFPVGRYATARYSLLRVAPATGRMHQIRRHMKHIFHPVIGDTTYGDGKQNEFFRTQFDCRRLLLHAYSIAFKHPHADMLLQIQAPLDHAFNALLKALDWDRVALG